MLGWFVPVQGQTIHPFGAEFSLSGAVSGDQVMPAVAVSSEGGWIVWQDNSLNEFATSIAATRLNANLVPSMPTVQISPPVFITQHDRQTKFHVDFNSSQPDVALRPDGGAAVVWERGAPGATECYLQVIDANGGFIGSAWPLTPPVLSSQTVESLPRMSWKDNQLVHIDWQISKNIDYKRNLTHAPRVAMLSNGTMAVTCSGVRKASTNTFRIVTQIESEYRNGATHYSTNDVLQPISFAGEWKNDVFLQRFNAQRQPVGPEVVVNQFAPNHQGQPDIAALSNGNMVIVWVSENRLGSSLAQPDVSVHGRLFDGEGTPLGDEFVINSAVRICGRPKVAAGSDGGFAVVWNQKDSNRNISWDIYVRLFDANGQPSSKAHLVNERTYGDQFEPSIAGVGQSFLVTWTSLNQDGSREGIFGRLLGGRDLAGSEFQINSTAKDSQFQSAVGGNGAGKILAAWTHYGDRTSMDLQGQVFRVTQPLPAPAAPVVTALSEHTLRVNWNQVGTTDLNAYELYVDGAEFPVLLQENAYELAGLESESAHVFQLAYVLNDGRRSLLSGVASGTTLKDPGDTSGENPTDWPPDDSGGGNEGDDEPGPLVVALEDTPNGVVVRWSTVRGRSYQLYVSFDLERWLEWGPPRQASGGKDSLEVVLKVKNAFFRVTELP